MFKQFKVRWEFKNRLMAGTPANPALIGKWLEARKASESKYKKLVDTVPPEELKSLEQLEEEKVAALPNIPEEADTSYLVFLRDEEKRLYLESYTIKAHLKDCCRVLGSKESELIKVKQFRSKFADRCFPGPEHIYITNGTPEPLQGDAPIAGQFWEHAVHVMTALGPRNALKSNEYAEKATLEFTLKVLGDDVVDKETLEMLMEYGSEHGYGGERGMGFGKYSYTVEEMAS